eukprot:s5851_g3.t1
MEELGYEASVNREICVLKMLSHPGIARMVAAFRYRDGAYLVLEYAHKGDLHNILVGAGKLEEDGMVVEVPCMPSGCHLQDVVRFLVGEVVAALCAIHDIGFMYGDLKPENVVVTSSNHAKLTDFGGCRPITDEAPALPWSQHGANCRHTARHMSHFDLTRLLFNFGALTLAAGHGQLTVPLVRGDSLGRRESHEQRAPVYTLDGNRGGYSPTSMRCHDFNPDSDGPKTTLQAGSSFDVTWTMEAGHPGDCYFYISYDPDPSNVVNFFKIAAIPGCGASDGLNIPSSVSTSVLLPAELPACEHCVLRWEWTGHQQVVNIEFYVQCADIKITSSAQPVVPSPVTPISGIEHLPQGAEGYRKVYNGQGPEEQYLVGPAIATYGSCDANTPGCLGLGIVPIPTDSTSPSAATSTTSETSVVTSPSDAGCTCTSSTEWTGDFSQYASDQDFCSQNFGGSNPWISAGGGPGTSGGFSGAGPCTSGQYAFQEDGSWHILAGQEDALGVMPYRAFAYAQFCNGKAYSECWTTGEAAFSFSLMVRGVSQTGAFVKVLFWTDSGNILGLVPASHPKGEGKLRLVAFMTDDYPNSWDFELEISESTWYHIQVAFQASTGAAEVSVNGVVLGSGTLPVNMLAATTGPQIGIYSFDYGTSWPADGVVLSLADVCIGTVAGTCRSGVIASPTEPSSSVASTALSTTAAGATSGTSGNEAEVAAGTTTNPAEESAGVVTGADSSGADSCPLEGFGLPSFVSQCYCGFVGPDGAGCGPDDGTACWCKCCCHHVAGGSCRYRMTEMEAMDELSSHAVGASIGAMSMGTIGTMLTAAVRCRQALLKRLRDGDWQAQDVPEATPAECEEEELVAEDDRVEGTMLYLPPEAGDSSQCSLSPLGLVVLAAADSVCVLWNWLSQPKLPSK